MTGDKDPKEEERERLDLELENQALRKDLEIRGMQSFGKAEDLPPETENEFLHNIRRMEDAMENPFCKIRDLFPEDERFPPEEELGDDEIEELMDRIAATLADHQIYFGVNEEVPARAIYRYFLEDVLDDDVLFENPPEGFDSVLDGCTGYCPDCFQRDYCETAKSLDWDEDKSAGGETSPPPAEEA